MRKKKVMVVDDEEDFLKLIKMNLESTGKYQVQTLSNASDIIAQVRLFDPDVLLLDVIMPKTDGVEVCKKLNNDPTRKQLSIIVLSALDKAKNKLIMHKLDVADFLVKPIEKNELIAKIEKVLQNK